MELPAIWCIIGISIGLLTCLTGLTPTTWKNLRWLLIPIIGAICALAGGIAGTSLFGRLFSTAMALWISIVATLLPWIGNVLYKQITKNKSRTTTRISQKT